VNPRGLAQTLERFFERLVTEAKSAVVHRDESFRLEFRERLHGFFRVHMYFASKRRIVRTDWQERDLDVVAFADFFESLEIGGVSTMKNRPAIQAKNETAEAAMGVSQKTRSPMMRRCERNSKRTELDRLPFIELVHDVESQAVDQAPDADRNDDGLIGGNRPQRSPIEMIEMRVGDENEINRGQMMNIKTGFLEAFDHAEPHRPDRIDQDIDFVRLNQERSVTDPGNGNLAGLHVWKQRTRVSWA